MIVGRQVSNSWATRFQGSNGRHSGRQLGDKLGEEVGDTGKTHSKTRFQGSRWETQCNTQWETSRRQVGDKAADKVPRFQGSKVPGGRHSGKQAERLGDRVQRFPEPCGYMLEERGTRHHPLLEYESLHYCITCHFFDFVQVEVGQAGGGNFQGGTAIRTRDSLSERNHIAKTIVCFN